MTPQDDCTDGPDMILYRVDVRWHPDHSRASMSERKGVFDTRTAYDSCASTCREWLQLSQVAWGWPAEADRLLASSTTPDFI